MVWAAASILCGTGRGAISNAMIGHEDKLAPRCLEWFAGRPKRSIGAKHTASRSMAGHKPETDGSSRPLRSLERPAERDPQTGVAIPDERRSTRAIKIGKFRQYIGNNTVKLIHFRLICFIYK